MREVTFESAYKANTLITILSPINGFSLFH